MAVIDRTTWKTILISIVSGGLLVYVVRPILDHLPSAVLGIVEAISQRWADLIFRDAAAPKSTEGLLLVALSLVFSLGASWFLGVHALPSFPRFSRSIFVGMLVGTATATLFIGAMRSQAHHSHNASIYV